MNEGYTKYQIAHTIGPIPEDLTVDELLRLRNSLHQLGWIGFYENLGVGYGNVSERMSGNGEFLITGTQTGAIFPLTKAGLSIVTQADIGQNRLVCTGPVAASSEALTHAAVYQTLPQAGVVIHLHHFTAWQTALTTLPATSAEVEYGTPEMGREVERILQEAGLPASGFLAMAGHEEGLLAWGRTHEEAMAATKAHMEALLIQS